MLVLTRKKGEAVVIGEEIVVSVVEVRGDKVRLGFEAPRDVSIHRREIWLKIHAPAEESPDRYESESA